jgi:hypothetical protein
MSDQKPKLDHLLWAAAGGLLTGAWWVKNQNDEAKKSRAEKDDAEEVEAVCEAIGPILDDWEPKDYDAEDGFVEDLHDYLVTETDGEFGIEMFPSTREGRPDILIDDILAIEVKVALAKIERDRLIGQTAAYSREWVTWIVLIDTPDSQVGSLEKLLADKGLDHILVFGFS